MQTHRVSLLTYQGGLQKFVKLYCDLLESGQAAKALKELLPVVAKLPENSRTSGAAMSKPSREYRRVRALLHAPRALNLFFDQALRLPRAGNETDMLLLTANLHSLRLMLLCPEFAALLAKAGVLAKLRPLLLHTAEWLKTDSILDAQKEAERALVGEALEVAVSAAGGDNEDGLAFVNESGLFPRLQAHLPWQKQVRLTLEMAQELSVILQSAINFRCISLAAARKEKVKAIEQLFEKDVFGWIQGMALWAAAAADGNTEARAPLDAFVGRTFTLLGMFIVTASMTNRLSTNWRLCVLWRKGWLLTSAAGCVTSARQRRS